MGLLADGQIGPIRQANVTGPLLEGDFPPAGVTLVVARSYKVPLSAWISSAELGRDGEAVLTFEDVSFSDLHGAYAVSSDVSLLANVAQPTPAPGEPTPEDEYEEFTGPRLSYTWGKIEGVDVELMVVLGQTPTVTEQASLERAIRAWNVKGVSEGFGTERFWGGTGHLHGLYAGPRWRDRTLRWVEDFGSADADFAVNDLARRLAGWSQRHGVAVTQLRFGR